MPMPSSGNTSPHAPGATTTTGPTTTAHETPPYPVRQDVNKMFRARCWAELNQGLVRGATVKLRVQHEEVFMRLWRQLRYQSDNFHKVTTHPFSHTLNTPPLIHPINTPPYYTPLLDAYLLIILYALQVYFIYKHLIRLTHLIAAMYCLF